MPSCHVRMSLSVHSKASGPHDGNASCGPFINSLDQKTLKFGSREIAIYSFGSEKSATVCLKDVSIAVRGTSVTEAQYAQFVSDLGEPFFAKLENLVATME